MWIELRQDLAEESMSRFTSVLTGWLRDEMLGPAPCPEAALVQLRATQAALFTRGILLRWDAAALGPDPAQRLPGDLTADRAIVLGAVCCRTDTAAVTALCLHLNHGTADFEHLSISDVAPDGSALLRHQADDPGRTRTGQASGPRHGATLTGPADGDPVKIPACARPILAAHLAYRRSQGAVGSDPYFAHLRDPGSRSPQRVLHNAVTRICHAIGYDMPWMHSGDCNCRYGVGTGLAAREPAWLAERGLSLYRIDPAISDRVPGHGSPLRYRPGWLDAPAAVTPATQPPQARSANPAPASPAPYGRRIAESGLSPWELGDLLGIHPHLLTGPTLADQPARILVELARALQMHPADLYPDLDSVLGNRRAAPGPGHHEQNPPAEDRASDAVTLLTALACARTPLGPADLATVLLAALAFGQAPHYASFREDHSHAEHALKQAGVVHSCNGPYHARVSKDVRFSLRYGDDKHIAAERGETGLQPASPAVSSF